TLATRADTAGIRTCVVSTDRDAFQLVSENVILMMTPRGVADVNVYTPERVEARYGIRPDQIPDFIGLKGDSSDNIPGVPGIGDEVPWREGELAIGGRVGYGAVGERAAVATEDGVVVGARPARVEGDLVVHDAKALGVHATDDTLLAAYLIEPGRASYELTDL